MATRLHPDWRSALVESYAELFDPVGSPLAAPGWPSVDDGWRDLLERACVRIRAAVRPHGGPFRVTEISEKYGTLRVRWEGSLSPEVAARVEEAVNLAEARSATTCEVCGDAGVLRAGDWLATRCEAHAEGRPPVEVEEGIENLHVERRLVGGRWRTLFLRYDRAGDRFVEAGRPRRKGE
jgi:hypothetical protein